MSVHHELLEASDNSRHFGYITYLRGEALWDVLIDPPDDDEVLEARRVQSRMRKREARRSMTPERREQQRASDRERMKVARENATPEQRASDRMRKKVARRNATEEQLDQQRAKDCERKKTARGNATEEQHDQLRASDRERKKAARLGRLRPFWGVDGEGAGTDAKGRQHYILMAASGPGADDYRVKHRDGAALSVKDCLEFLLSLPADPILVGFYFGYDANQILRGIYNSNAKDPYATLKRILDPPQGPYGPRSTFWGEYAIDYQPFHCFKVSRIDRSGNKPVPDTRTTRTVYDVYAFFQRSFVNTIENWNIGSEREHAFVADMKNRRELFDALTPEMIDYCALECRALALLMTKFRDVCYAADIRPERWYGPGAIAASLLKKHGIPKRPLTASEVARRGGFRDTRRSEREPEFEVAANLAFYGGRFEVSRIGHVPGPVWEYDLNSAYPAAMLTQPCPLHTRWRHRPNARRLPSTGLFLAKITFEHLGSPPWCGLPFRRKTIYWPYQGTGWYWSCEIKAAQRLGVDFSVRDLWVAEQPCDCRPYDWVAALYAERKRLGSKTRGYPLKLGLNSLYGKKAQRSGRAPYHDAAAAGLITATTRARLIEAVAHDPGAVVMLATDAVYSTRELPLDIGDGLGQWGRKKWSDLFIAQPGVYWSPTELKKGVLPTVKSRGAPGAVIRKAAPQFERVFDEWIAMLREAGHLAAVLSDRDNIPKVMVKVRVFHGCALTLARGKPWLAGTWKDDVPKAISFDWGTKRHPTWKVALAEDGSDSLVTVPLSQSKLVESEGYEPLDFDSENDEQEMSFEAMPDHVPYLPSEE